MRIFLFFFIFLKNIFSFSQEAVEEIYGYVKVFSAEGKSKAILFNLCGHGHFDMQAYMDYFSGNLAEDKFDTEAFEESMASIPAVN